ncbi:related to CHS5 - chitin biosynthesis protein [Ustilago trichophora]|uniref:Chitin biosynthesis protein CHS5 n=1 Tax=Ustilago trichophora TaxID=86804 RepID=A0A5C3E0U8_9BASI|nr:related to CHS5 - chitin biosynthesis protein [Ustilago trichophora]
MSAHYVGQIAPNYIHSTMQSNSADDSFTFTVGKLDAGMAILIGEKASLIEFPSLLLPPGVSSGSVVNIRVMRNDQQERRQKDEFDQLQEDILHTFGQQSPKAPALRLRNVTQTSVTLEWDRLTLATATLLSLDIYRNGQRLAPIPNPLHNTSTKLSGLDVNAEYTFHLVMKTTAGTFSSPVIKTRTHTINDTSGISVCFGHVHDSEMLEAAKQALNNMKAKWHDRIQIDTTHYICTDPRNPGDVNAPQGSQGHGYAKAMQLSIPAVLPHWIFACHDQKKMVGISPFYLDQDPPNASTIRGSIDKVLGKQASSSNTTSPPPPLEKDGQTPAAEAPVVQLEQVEAKSAPFAAEDVSPRTEVPAPEASGSALGLNLANEEEATPTQPTQPTPIITTSAPSDDGDVEPREHEPEPEPEPEPEAATASAPTPAPPQVVITPSESEEHISAPEPTQHAHGEEEAKPSETSHTDALDADDDADGDGEMDDVSLGGGTHGEDDSREDKATY